VFQVCKRSTRALLQVVQYGFLTGSRVQWAHRPDRLLQVIGVASNTDKHSEQGGRDLVHGFHYCNDGSRVLPKFPVAAVLKRAPR
jgi:hypothetical protein